MIEVIAEIGVNHNGCITTALELVDAAVAAGCDAVKTQVWNTERVYPQEQWAKMKGLELSRTSIKELKRHCDDRKIEFFATPDELDDAKFLVDLGVKRIKTSSQDVTNLPFLRGVAKLGLPVIFSTGACSWSELMEGAFEILDHGAADITILHCVSAYPAPLAEMNIKVIANIETMFGCRVGLSDHTTTIEAAIMALAMGATVFEKHLTLDCHAPGPDHKASFDPEHMQLYVRSLRRCHTALGDGRKRVMPCEMENRKKFLEFVARRDNGVD